MIPGHLPKLESHVGKAIQSIQRLPGEEKAKLALILQPLMAAMKEQSDYNRRLGQGLQTVDSETSNLAQSLVPFFMFSGS